MASSSFFQPLSLDCFHTRERIFNFDLNGGETQKKTNYVNTSIQQQTQAMTKTDEMLYKPKETHLADVKQKLVYHGEQFRKLKITYEIDYQQKEKQIQEYNSTVDTLRKAVFEVQLQNESLSSKLQEETSNREEALQKIEGNRNMCTILKDHTMKLKDRLDKYECNHLQVEEYCSSKQKEFEELAEKFTGLSLHYTEKLKKVESLKSELETRLENQISKDNLKFTNLQNEIFAKSEILEEMRSQLGKKELEKTDLIIQINNLNSKDKEIQGKMLILENQMDQYFSKIQMLEKDNENKETELKNKITILEDVSANYETLCEKLKSEEEINQKLITDLRSQMQNQQEKLLTEEQSKQQWIQKHSEAERRIESLQLKSDSLQMDLASKYSEIEKFKEDKIKMEKEVNEIQNQLDSCMKENEVLRTNKEMQFNKKVNLEKEIDEVKKQYESSKNKLLEIRTELTENQKSKEILNEEYVKLKEEHLYLNKQLLDLQVKVNQNEEEVKALQFVIQEAQAKEKLLLNEINEQTKKNSEKMDLNQKLTEELKKVTSDFGVLQIDYKHSTERILFLEEKYQLQNQEHLDLEVKLKNSEDECEVLRKNCQDFQLKMHKLEAEICNVKEVYQSSSDDYQNRTMAMVNEVKAQAGEIESLKQEKAKCEHQIHLKEQEIISLRKNSEVTMTQMKNNKKIMESLQLELQEERMKKAQLYNECENLKKEVIKNAERISFIVEENNNLKSVTQQAMKDKEDSTKSFREDLNEMFRTLDSCKKEQQQEIIKKEKEIQSLKDQIRNLDQIKSKEINYVETISRLEKQASNLTNEVEKLKLQKEACENEKIQLQSEIEKLKNIPVLSSNQATSPHSQNSSTKRSILKTTSTSPGLKKKVMFSPIYSDSSDCLDLQDIEDKLRGKMKKPIKSVQPLRAEIFSKSPIRNSPYRTIRTSSPIPENISKEKKRSVPKKQIDLFDRILEDTNPIKKTKQSPQQQQANIANSNKKFFKHNVQSRWTTSLKKRTKKDEAAWIDLDRVFGFSTED